jgi:hypothetical protein
MLWSFQCILSLLSAVLLTIPKLVAIRNGWERYSQKLSNISWKLFLKKVQQSVISTYLLNFQSKVFGVPICIYKWQYLVLLGVQICIYKWQYSIGWCKGHSCGRSLTFQVVRIPFHFPRFWMPLICLHFHFGINANIQSSSLKSNLYFCSKILTKKLLFCKLSKFWMTWSSLQNLSFPMHWKEGTSLLRIIVLLDNLSPLENMKIFTYHLYDSCSANQTPVCLTASLMWWSTS